MIVIYSQKPVPPTFLAYLQGAIKVKIQESNCICDSIVKEADLVIYCEVARSMRTFTTQEDFAKCPNSNTIFCWLFQTSTPDQYPEVYQRETHATVESGTKIGTPEFKPVQLTFSMLYRDKHNQVTNCEYNRHNMYKLQNIEL